jgi:Dolichyl-phosphate-mannose-protein mannosyltransferase
VRQPRATTPYQAAKHLTGPARAATIRAVGAVAHDRSATLATLWPLLGIVAATMLGAALRLSRLDDLSLRNDEGFTLLYTHQSWAAVLGLHGFYDAHPPLFFALAKLGNLVVAESIAARVVAAVAGIATIPVVYRLGTRLLDERAGLAAALLVAFSPLHIAASRDGRMYAPVTLAVVVSYDALVAYWQRPAAWRGVLYGVAVAAAVYIDYSAAYALAPQALLLGVAVWKLRRRAAWLVGGAAMAVLAYVPWLPQIAATIDGVNQNERRTEILGATWRTIGNAVPFLVGLDGRASAARMHWPHPLDRWPGLHPLFLILVIPAGFVGALVLCRNRLGLAVALALAVGVPATAVLISEISPGFAVRTLVPATVGWSLLTGAVFARDRALRPLPRWLRAVGVAGWCYLLVISVVAIPPLYAQSGRVRWKEASVDLARLNTRHYPIVTYSMGGMDTDLIDLYAGDRLNGARRITVVDGVEEHQFGAQRWLDRGPTLKDVEAGKLGELLSDTPENGAVWFVTHRSTGSPVVRKALAALGYDLLLHRRYTGLTMELYARPGTDLGRALDVNGSLAGTGNTTSDWEVPAAASFQPVTRGDGRRKLVLSSKARGQTAVYRAEGTMPGLYTLRVTAVAMGDNAAARATIRCLAADGSVRYEASQTTDGKRARTPRTLRFAAPCPSGTIGVAIVLENVSAMRAEFWDIYLFGLADADHPG